MGITDPSEEYFKDGAWGWNGTKWVQLPLVFGYHDRWAEDLGGTKSGDGIYVALSSTVPAGEVWVVQIVQFLNASGARGDVLIQLMGGVDYATVVFASSPGSGVVTVFSGPLVLKEGGRREGCTGGVFEWRFLRCVCVGLQDEGGLVMELPDWLRGIVLLGRDGAEYRVVGVDEDGHLGVILQAAAEVTIPGDVSVDQNDSIREMQGVEGVTLRTVAVDANGQIIMVPRGSTGNYMAVDANGYLGAILKAAAEVTIPGDVSVDQNDSIREMQGVEGVTLRTVAVDASGQIIMVPRGNTGNYMAVDANGFLSSLMKGIEGANLRTIAVDANGNLISVIKGLEGANLRNIAVDASGQIIMVPRGQSGYYLGVDSAGYMTTVMKGDYGPSLRTVRVDAAGNLITVVQGYDGEDLQTVAVDTSGQMIMVPRGQSGHYLGVDSDGYMTTVIKGTYGATLKTLAADDEGYLVAILKDNADQWGEKISVGLAELAARLGSPISWERRGQVALIETFADGLGRGVTSTSGTGASAELYPAAFQTGGYSYQLKTGTTVGKSAGVTVYGDFSPSSRLGFEVVFSMDSQPDYIYLLAKIWDGTLEHHAYARINKSLSELQVYNDTPGYQGVADFQLAALAPLFCSVKVVIDLDAQRWVRVLSRGTEGDISAIVTDVAAVAVHPYFSFQVLAVESAAVSHTIYLDRMIVTTNEP